ncbi:erythroferrone [Antechinus flavipes]|uniref:erythroferrone n=1 Tax=Antechinus flavipes TaxID=38775 RepID=UPI00223694D5|nr:erythroferrone [Antechinus flavipes]
MFVIYKGLDQGMGTKGKKLVTRGLGGGGRHLLSALAFSECCEILGQSLSVPRFPHLPKEGPDTEQWNWVWGSADSSPRASEPPGSGPPRARALGQPGFLGPRQGRLQEEAGAREGAGTRTDRDNAAQGRDGEKQPAWGGTRGGPGWGGRGRCREEGRRRRGGRPPARAPADAPGASLASRADRSRHCRPPPEPSLLSSLERARSPAPLQDGGPRGPPRCAQGPAHPLWRGFACPPTLKPAARGPGERSFLGLGLALRGDSGRPERTRRGPRRRAPRSGTTTAVLPSCRLLLLPPGCRLLLLLLGLLAAASCVGSEESERDAGGRGPERRPPGNALPMERRLSGGPLPSSNDLEAPATEKPQSINPRDAWMLFVRQSNKGVNGKKKNTGKSRKYKLGLPGPPGPPGPQGPPGPLISPEDLWKEFQALLKGALRHRDRAGPRPCEACGEAEEEEKAEAAADEEDVLALVAGPLLESRRPQRVEAAFHCRVRRNTSVERRSLQELQLYHLPGKEGSFQRGPGLNLTSGQYTAPITGFYTFAATLYVGKSLGRDEAGVGAGGRLSPGVNGARTKPRGLTGESEKDQGRGRVPGRGSLCRAEALRLPVPGRGSLCRAEAPCAGPRLRLPGSLCRAKAPCARLRLPGSLCRAKAPCARLRLPGSLCRAEALRLPGPGRAHARPAGSLPLLTAPLRLPLQAGQYVSVFVDNASGSSLTVRGGSDFSAVFLGL